MCIICTDYQKNLNPIQGMRNLFEIKDSIGKDHVSEVISMMNIDLDDRYPNSNGLAQIAKALKDFTAKKEPNQIDKNCYKGLKL